MTSKIGAGRSMDGKYAVGGAVAARAGAGAGAPTGRPRTLTARAGTARAAMPSASLTFASRAEHRAWLETQSALPEGFHLGTTSFGSSRSRYRSPAA